MPNTSQDLLAQIIRLISSKYPGSHSSSASTTATVLVPTGSGFLFENNYVTSGKGIVFQFGTNENVVFKNLGLVVTDEQHRFGVRQRATIVKKGENRWKSY